MISLLLILGLSRVSVSKCMSQGDQNRTEFRWTVDLRWLPATMGLNSVPPERLEFHFKARKRKGYLE